MFLLGSSTQVKLQQRHATMGLDYKRRREEESRVLPMIPGFRMVKLLGSGSIACVYSAHICESSSLVAVKVLKTNAALELQPDATMEAILASVKDFAMPGNGIEGFQRKAVEIAVAGIYDLKQHRDEVIMPVLRKWKIFERNDFGPYGEAAREELAQILADMDVSVNRFEDRREALRARLLARD